MLMKRSFLGFITAVLAILTLCWGLTANATIFWYGSGGTPTSPLYVVSSAVTGTGISGGSGYIGVGSSYTITLTMSQAATVITALGTPTLSLNDGDTATYSSGSGTTSLVYTATVSSGAVNTPKLAITGSNLSGGTIKNGSNNANMSAALNPLPGTLAVIVTPPTVSNVASLPASGNVITGQSIIMTVTFSSAVNVNTGGGTPTMCLNSGGTAVYSGGSGTNQITFTNTVSSTNATSQLAPCGSNAIATNGATIKDLAGNNAVLTGANGYVLAGVVAINTGAMVTTVSISPSSGTFGVGATLNLSVVFSAPVVVTGGPPTLVLISSKQR